MPVIVVGADTEIGHAIVPALRPVSGEIRLFASDAEAVAGYRAFAKVAIGDISDGTHVGGAAIGAFCAIAIAAAGYDDRERHFASTPTELFIQWADGLADAGISRIVFVGPDVVNPLSEIGAEYFVVDPADLSVTEAVEAILAAENAARL